RSMAKLAAIMANGGQPLDVNSNEETSSNNTFHEPQLLSPSTYSLITTRLPTTFDQVLQENITATIGGFGYFRLEGFEDMEFIGWGGSGGSLLLWNPELKVGFGYCMNAFHTALLGDKRSLKMLKEVVDYWLVAESQQTVRWKFTGTGAQQFTLYISNDNYKLSPQALASNVIVTDESRDVRVSLNPQYYNDN
ncbi:373_t:CDS:2, partial [Acaulospora morrowiae]